MIQSRFVFHVLFSAAIAFCSQSCQTVNVGGSGEEEDHEFDPLPVQKGGSVEKASKNNPYINSIGMKFVPIPGTNLLMSVYETRVREFAIFMKQSKYNWAANAGREHFAISWTDNGGPNHPVSNVHLGDAKAFCQWLSRKEGLTYRLPTDHEWSIAVGIGDKENASESIHAKHNKLTNLYPWGSGWPPPPGSGNYNEPSYFVPKVGESYPDDGFDLTAPVGAFKPNPLGLYDMGAMLKSEA